MNIIRYSIRSFFTNEYYSIIRFASKRLFVATLLQTHIKSVHEGQKIPCPHCEYKATRKGNLQTHIKSVHEGKKFPCPHFEHKATDKANLRRHIKSVHIGQNFPCQDWKTEADDMVVEEYFEKDVKLEVDSIIKLEGSTKLKLESLSVIDDDELEEYFEKEVKSEVDSDSDHD